MEQQEINKFKIAEILLCLSFTLLIDGVCALIDWLGLGISAFITMVIQWFTVFIIGFWFKSKGNPDGLKMGRMIFKLFIQALPGAEILTALTTTIPSAIEIYLHNNPKKFAAAAKFLETVPGEKLLAKAAGKVKL